MAEAAEACRHPSIAGPPHAPQACIRVYRTHGEIGPIAVLHPLAVTHITVHVRASCTQPGAAH